MEGESGSQGQLGRSSNGRWWPGLGAVVATERSSQILGMGVSEKRRHMWTLALASLCDLESSLNLSEPSSSHLTTRGRHETLVRSAGSWLRLGRMLRGWVEWRLTEDNPNKTLETSWLQSWPWHRLAGGPHPDPPTPSR